ncbi:MAG: 2-oxoacid:acceptor oxidoreductase subunit alpha [Candidatus Njordarchaeales archaeon]
MVEALSVNELFPPGRYFLMGNEALAIGALLAGCRFFAGYPITPSSEIMNFMARYLPLVGGTFIQMEDELSSIMAVIGASWAGVRSMTATSGPGFSLMQEGIGYAIMTETPIVLVDVMRVGPGTGQATKSAQGDVMQARWGRHGDQEIIAIAPAFAQEMLELTIDAFNLADTYRVPVILLPDEIIGHLEEVVEIPSEDSIIRIQRIEPKSPEEPRFGGDGARIAPMPIVGKGYNALITGSTHDEKGYRKTQDPNVHRRLAWHLVNKIRRNRDKIVKYEIIENESARIGIVAYGSVYRAAREAIDLAKKKGLRINLFRPITLWPSPERQLRKFAENLDAIIVPEMNTGMYVLEIERIVKDLLPVYSLTKIGGGEPITPEEILRFAENIIKEGIKK